MEEGPCSELKSTLAILEIIIAAVGLFLNGISVFVIVILKDYKKSISHWYVLQLAIADSVFLALLPLNGHQHLYGSWKFPHWTCHIFKAMFFTNYYAEVFFLTVMSFDRYVAIVHPVSAYWRKLRTHGNAVLITTIVWIASVLLSIPIWIWSGVNCTCGFHFPPESNAAFYEDQGIPYEYQYYEFSAEYYDEQLYEFSAENGTIYIVNELNEFTECFNPPWKSFQIWMALNFTLTFALPVVIMAICYSLILWRVLHPTIASANKSFGRRKSTESQSRKRRSSLLNSFRSSVSSTSSRSSSRSMSQKHKVTAIVVSLVAVFILCWFPYYVVQFVKIKGMKFTRLGCILISDVVALIAFLNSMLNPIFYTFLGSKFHQRVRIAIRTAYQSTKASGFIRYSRSSRNGVPPGVRASGTVIANKVTEGSITGHVHTTHSSVSKHHHYSQRHRPQH